MKKNKMLYCKQCNVCGELFSPSSFSSTSESPSRWEKRKYCSHDCAHKSLIGRNRDMPWMNGENNPRWKGGITPINTVIRNSKEYRLWRNAVFERDNYTCIWCGIRGTCLHADHIKPFCDYPELRFAIDNGRTLCVECHQKTETYPKNLIKKTMTD